MLPLPTRKDQSFVLAKLAHSTEKKQIGLPKQM